MFGLVNVTNVHTYVPTICTYTHTHIVCMTDEACMPVMPILYTHHITSSIHITETDCVTSQLTVSTQEQTRKV